MSETVVNNGGPAFPRPMSEFRNDDGASTHREPDQEGMTLRAYFAARAMQGLIHDILIDQPFEDRWIKSGRKTEELPAFLAHLSVMAADALISELSGTSGQLLSR